MDAALHHAALPCSHTVSAKPGSGTALECCLVTGGRAVSGGSSAALFQGDEQRRPISYAGLGPWV